MAKYQVLTCDICNEDESSIERNKKYWTTCHSENISLHIGSDGINSSFKHIKVLCANCRNKICTAIQNIINEYKEVDKS